MPPHEVELVNVPETCSENKIVTTTQFRKKGRRNVAMESIKAMNKVNRSKKYKIESPNGKSHLRKLEILRRFEKYIIRSLPFQTYVPTAMVMTPTEMSSFRSASIECENICFRNMVIKGFSKHQPANEINVRQINCIPRLGSFENLVPDVKIKLIDCTTSFLSSESVDGSSIHMMLSSKDITISVDTSDLVFLYANFHYHKLNMSIIAHLRCFNGMAFRSNEHKLKTNTFFSESEHVRFRANRANISLKNQRSISCFTVDLKHVKHERLRVRVRDTSLFKTQDFEKDENNDSLKAELRQLTELAHPPHICSPVEYTVAPVSKGNNPKASSNELDGGENTRTLSTEPASSDINDMQVAYCTSNVDHTIRAELSNSKISVDCIQSQSNPTQIVSEHTSHSNRISADPVNDSRQNELAHSSHICSPVKYTVAPLLKGTNSEAKNNECDGGDNTRTRSIEPASSNINDMEGAYCISNVDQTIRSELSNDKISVDCRHSQSHPTQIVSENTSYNSNRKSVDPVNDSRQNEIVAQSPTSEGNGIANGGNTILPNPNVEDEELQRFEPLMNVIDKIAYGERVPPQITMQYEMLRFCTLRSYPKENKPYITRLAQAGFYYANSGDEVVCYCCARRRSNWRETDIPMDIHREMNPNCKFLLRNSEVNIPIRGQVLSSNIPWTLTNTSTLPENIPCSVRSETNPSTNRSFQHTGRHKEIRNMTVNTTHQNVAVTGAFSSDLRMNRSFDQLHLGSAQARAHGNFVHVDMPSSRPQENVTALDINSEVSPTGSDRTSQNGRVCEGTTTSTLAKYPKYASKTVRITSFNDCGDIVVPPDSLAESGFFYAGFGDCVRCFQCGVGLRHWSEEDDPWIEHSRWSKDCLFVKQMKGQEFVNLVQMAVQYSQNQNETGESQNATAASNTESSGREDVENLLHTDAAQSVLEMGYNPNIIRRAIKAIVEDNGRDGLTAAHIMEKIFEIEDSDNVSNTVQNGEHAEQFAQSTHPQHDPSVMNGIAAEQSDRNSIETQRTTAPVEAPSINEANNSISSSIQSNIGPSLSSHSGPEHARATRKSQLLEQKKLKEENEKLKQQSICTKCKQNDVCIVFLPCGHLVTCEECAPTVRYCTMQSCGKYIKGTVRTYLA